MANVIACRLLSYGKYQARGWSHLPEIGVHNVELPVPTPAELAGVRKQLADHGLKATSLQAKCDVTQANVVEVMQPQLQACADLGAKVCFLSAKAGETDPAVVWSHLRAIGDVAAKLGVTVALETHPDLITNGDRGRATMEAIKHPAVRVNFDTANVYFYNQNVTAVGELGKVIDYVASVHLKDTTGGYEDWTFPTLGTGVVDFAEVFRMLNARGFAGPFTMELEGTKGVELDEAGQLKYIADSVAYLRRIEAL